MAKKVLKNIAHNVDIDATMTIFENIPSNQSITAQELIDYLLDNNKNEFKTKNGSIIYDISDIDDELMEFLQKNTYIIK